MVEWFKALLSAKRIKSSKTSSIIFCRNIFSVSIICFYSKQTVYWVEMENEDDINGTLYMSNIGGGDKINFFDEFDTGMVGSPSAIAFDWIGRNLYIANQVVTYTFSLRTSYMVIVS